MGQADDDGPIENGRPTPLPPSSFLQVMIAFVICPLMLLAPLSAASPHCFTHPSLLPPLLPYRSWLPLSSVPSCCWHCWTLRTCTSVPTWPVWHS